MEGDEKGSGQEGREAGRETECVREDIVSIFTTRNKDCSFAQIPQVFYTWVARSRSGSSSFTVLAPE